MTNNPANESRREFHSPSRAALRYRRSLLAGFGTLAAKGVAVASTLIAIPVVLGYLGTDRFGIWATCIGLISALTFADLGVGNGLLTSIAIADGKENGSEATGKLVSSAFFLLLAFSLILVFLAIAISPLVVWTSIFNAPHTVNEVELRMTGLALVLPLIAAIPFGLVQKIQLGYQEGAQNAIWQAAGAFLSLAAVLLGVLLETGLPFLVAAMVMGTLLVYAIQSGWLFFERRPWLRPRLVNFDWQSARAVLRLGAGFFILQLVVAFAFASDNLIIAQVMGAARVTPYAVQAQPFIWIGGVASVFLLPLWPAYGEAMAAGDYGWVRAALRRSLTWSVTMTAVPGGVLVAFGPQLFRLWVGDQVESDRVLLAGLAAWTVVATIGAALSVALNAGGYVAFQVATASAMGLMAVMAKIFGSRAFGLRGVIWPAVAVYTVTSLIPTARYVSRRLRPPGGPQ